MFFVAGVVFIVIAAWSYCVKKKCISSGLKVALVTTLVFLSAGVAIAGDEAAGLMDVKDISPDMKEQMDNVITTFQQPVKKEEVAPIVDKGNEILRNPTPHIKEFFPDMDNAALQLAEQKQSCGNTVSKDNTVYYFFSFSMSSPTILASVQDAVRHNEACNIKVVMVLRGFVENNIKTTIAAFYHMMNDSIRQDIPVEVNPELFAKFNVTAVPTAIQISGNKVGLISGVGIDFASAKFAENLQDYGTMGDVYPIKEEDILEVIKKKIPEIEAKVRESIPEIVEKSYVLNKYDGKFAHAEKDRVYYIDPAIVLTDDIKDQNGNILFQKGTVFNPTDYITLSRYIIIDGNDPKQVELALSGDFAQIILISGDLKKLVQTYRKQFFFANDLILNKFKIKAVPAIIEQEGKYVKITEVSP